MPQPYYPRFCRLVVLGKRVTDKALGTWTKSPLRTQVDGVFGSSWKYTPNKLEQYPIQRRKIPNVIEFSRNKQSTNDYEDIISEGKTASI